MPVVVKWFTWFVWLPLCPAALWKWFYSETVRLTFEPAPCILSSVELSAIMLQCGEARLSGKDKYRGKHRDPDRPHHIRLFSPQFLSVLLIKLTCHCSKWLANLSVFYLFSVVGAKGLKRCIYIHWEFAGGEVWRTAGRTLKFHLHC